MTGNFESAVVTALGGMRTGALIEDIMELDDYRQAARCPDAESLAAFAEDSLPLKDALEVAAHRHRCPICRADLADISGFVEQGISDLMAAIPAWSSPFIGRDDERESLGRMLESGSVPSVHVTAPGGGGKTRFSLESAVERSYLFSDGLWYAPLEISRTEDNAAGEIARAARLPLEPGAPAIDQIESFFKSKRGLLVVDDIAPDSAPGHMLSRLSSSCSDLCILTAGNVIGAIAGEGRTLQLPPLRTDGNAYELESMTLFREHARSIDSGFELRESDAPAATAICRRAAGIPLGIEIAAARAVNMRPPEMLTRMESLTNSSPDSSLGSLIDWSFGLLGEREQRFLCELAVFEGGFFADQAAAILKADDAAVLADKLHSLSLLQRSSALGRPRYRLLTPVARFARKRLGDGFVDTANRHSKFFMSFAAERADRLETVDQVEALAEMSTDLDNMRAGMDRNPQSASEIAVHLSRFLQFEGLWQEWDERIGAAVAALPMGSHAAMRARLSLAKCRLWRGDLETAGALMSELLNDSGTQELPGLRADVLFAQGSAALFGGRYEEAIPLLEQARNLYVQAGNRWTTADCLQNLGWLALQQGDYPRARKLLEESLMVQRERGERYRLAHTLSTLANIEMEQGRVEAAKPLFEEALRLCEEIGYARGIASAITNLGIIFKNDGDPVRAAYCFDRAVRQLQNVGDRRTLAQTNVHYGDLALSEGDLATARQRYQEAMTAAESVIDPATTAFVWDGLGRLALAVGELATAESHFRSALSQARETSAMGRLGVALHRMAMLSEKRSDFERAALLLSVGLTLCTARERAELGEMQEMMARLEKLAPTEAVAAGRRRAVSMTLDEVLSLA